MRALTLVVVVLGILSATQAIDLKDLGTNLVSSLVNQAKESLKTAATNFLSNLLGKLNIGKRDLTTVTDAIRGLTEKFGKLLEHGKTAASTAFKNALDKLKSIADKFHEKLGLHKDAKDSKDAVDAVVDGHNKIQKRVLAELFQRGKDLLAGAVAKAKEVLGSVKAKASAVVSTLLQKGVDIIGKRGILGDHLQKIGSALSSAVSPFKDIVASVGNTLKGHFSNLVDTVKGHVSALKDKLSGHVTDLKAHGSKLLEHGKNALGALSEVVNDILKQTIDNAKPHIDGAIKTIGDAGKTVVDHLSNGSN